MQERGVQPELHISYSADAKLLESEITLVEDVKPVLRLRMVVRAHVERVVKLVKEQSTDRDVWKVLKQQVFTPVRKLNLDGNPAQEQPRDGNNKPHRQMRERNFEAGAEWDISPGTDGTSLSEPPLTASPEVLRSALPDIVSFTLNHLHESYPHSPLCLALLPRLKSISRTTHLIVLTPAIYASLLSITWTRTNSPHRINTILQEMETEGVELDRSILASLSKILEEAEDMRKGKLGKIVQIVSGFDGWADQVEALREGWVPLVHQRIVAAAVREAHERERILRERGELISSS